MRFHRTPKLQRQIILFLIPLFLFTAPLFGVTDISEIQSNWVYLNRSSINENVQLQVSSAYTPGILIDFTLPGFYLNRSSGKRGEFHLIEFPDQCFSDKIGKPDLPILRETFAIPEGLDARVSILDGDYETFTNVMIKPVQPALDEGESVNDLNEEIDEKTYITDALYPVNSAEIQSVGYFRNVKLGEITISPFQYNPVQKTMIVARSMKLRIDFIGKNSAYIMETIRKIPSHIQPVLKGMVINYDQMNYSLENASDPNKRAIDYLIISNSSFVNSSALNDLVNYHKGIGRNVTVKDVSAIGSNPDSIKKTVQDAYAGNSLDFLLLVGDVDVIPFKDDVYYDSSKNEYYDSDIWYGWLSGNDRIADIGVGRLPARSASDLTKMVKKTIDFHKNTYPGSWRKKSLLVAHKEDYPGKYTECKKSIENHNYKLGGPTFDTLYGGDPNQYYTNSDVNSAINDGRIAVNYRGHGGVNEWRPWSHAQSGGYTTSNASSLNNGSKTPIVFSIACQNANMKSSTTSLAEAFIRQSAGAVAFLGANANSKTTVNNDFDRALYFGTWDNGIEMIGDLLNYANSKAQHYHGSTAYRNMTIYLWLGDPALSIMGSNPGPNPPDPDPIDPNSCKGKCGGQAPGGCYCDSGCEQYNDCCADKKQYCGF